MCTVTWLHDGRGYDLFFNRDELLTRQRATPPALLDVASVAVISPTDPDGGGSWISVNAHGVTLGLLNAYPAGDAAEGPAPETSRGLLLRRVCGARTAHEALGAVAGARLPALRPFRLLAVDASGTAAAIRWDRSELTLEIRLDGGVPLVSCPVEPDGVARHRRELLASMTTSNCGLDAALLARFHRSHDGGPGPHSVCTHRERARTHSLSHVRVGPQTVEMRYVDGPPCEGGEESVVTIARAVS